MYITIHFYIDFAVQTGQVSGAHKSRGAAEPL